jgi:hypothetical protein
VSTRSAELELRSFTIEDGVVTEEEVRVPEEHPSADAG